MVKMNKKEDIVDYTDILKFLKVGNLYKIYFNKNNVNNKIIKICAIIDNEVVVFKNIKFNDYCMVDLGYLDILYKDEILKRFNRELCIECNEKFATYVRYTQFSGDHYFCTKCAKKETDFNKDSSSFFWEKNRRNICG